MQVRDRVYDDFLLGIPQEKTEGGARKNKPKKKKGKKKLN